MMQHQIPKSLARHACALTILTALLTMFPAGCTDTPGGVSTTPHTPSTPAGSTPPAMMSGEGAGSDAGHTGGDQPPTGAPVSCTDICTYAGDGECDDGGPDSAYSVCDFGTDCMDCGPRDPATCVSRCEERTCGSDGCGGTCGMCPEGAECVAGACDLGPCEGRCAVGDYCNGDTGECESGTLTCNNACRFAGDGECDDGGPMCAFRLCDFGSDCGDCGDRSGQEPLPEEDPCPTAPGTGPAPADGS
jgi:hypothetical protein